MYIAKFRMKINVLFAKFQSTKHIEIPEIITAEYIEIIITFKII